MGFEIIDRLLRFGAKLVSQCHGAENATVASDQHEGFALATVIANFRKPIRWNRHAMLFEQCARADHDARPRFLNDDSFARRVMELRILA